MARAHFQDEPTARRVEMSLPFMPLFVGDWRRDTAHLSTEQMGAYFLLVCQYWAKGCLPNDDAQLARIVGMTPAKWRKARSILQAFFRDGWHHKRIDAELTKATAKAAANQERARRAANERWSKSE
jgi:uncharacterized protein YdaU (DUF1376 family)